MDHFDRLPSVVGLKFTIPFSLTSQIPVALFQLDRYLALGNRILNGKNHSAWLPWFNWKMLFHLALVYLDWFDLLDCEMESTPSAIK